MPQVSVGRSQQGEGDTLFVQSMAEYSEGSGGIRVINSCENYAQGQGVQGDLQHGTQLPESWYSTKARGSRN